MNTIQQAQGRWREILSVVGIDSNFLTGKPGPCPMCGGTDRWCFSDKTGEGNFICRGCGAGKGLQLVMRYNGWDFRRAATEVDRIIDNLPEYVAPAFSMQTSKLMSLRDIYYDAEPVDDGNAAGRYLANRGIDGPYPKVLRYVRLLKHKASMTTHRGMLAVFSDADGKAASMQRTFLKEDGHKADLEVPKLNLYGRTMPIGGAVRLGPVAEEMGIAEGVETALSAAQMFGMPVWATTSDHLLANWQPPPEAKRISIFGDNDLNYTGQAAAYALAKRLSSDKKHSEITYVSVRIPSLGGTDWNDKLRKVKSHG